MCFVFPAKFGHHIMTEPFHEIEQGFNQLASLKKQATKETAPPSSPLLLAAVPAPIG